MKIAITDDLTIDESELSFEFVRVSGPGGQNVNKVATGVDLLFDLANSPSLPPAVKDRLRKMASSQLTREGLLRIKARRFRTQIQNRQDAIDRLIRLIQKAAARPKVRKKSRPSKRAKEKRLDNKKRLGEKKRLRRRPRGELD